MRDGQSLQDPERSSLGWEDPLDLCPSNGRLVRPLSMLQEKERER